MLLDTEGTMQEEGAGCPWVRSSPHRKHTSSPADVNSELDPIVFYYFF